MQSSVNSTYDRVPERRAGWYLVQLRPNCVKMAERNLVRQGFEIFCPRYKATRKYRNVFREAVVPLFTGYLFCNIGEDPIAFRAVNSTYGVSRLVRFGVAYPRPVPDMLISGLRHRCDDSGLLEKMEDMKVGDRLRIKSGPFSDFISTVESIEEDKRVFVLLDLLGQAVKTELDIKDVEAI